MPKISRIRAFSDYDKNRSLAVSRDFAEDIGEAVEADHTCDSSACDICAALEQGFPFVAAFLLSGATECPAIDAMVSAHRFNGTATDGFRCEPFNAQSGQGTAPRGWREWCEWFGENARQCQACNGFDFEQEAEARCGNCLKGPMPLSLATLRNELDGASIGAMVPNVCGPLDLLETDGAQGTEWFPLVDFSEARAAAEALANDEQERANALAQRLSASLFPTVAVRVVRGGFLARWTMPGYLDATDAVAFETEREALSYLWEEYQSEAEED